MAAMQNTSFLSSALASALDWWRRNRVLLLIVLLVGAAVHYTIYANNLQTYDSLLTGSLYISDVDDPYWESEQGRWALRLVDTLRGGISTTPLAAFLMLLFFALAGVFLADLLELNTRTARLLAGLSVILSPVVAELETYHYCSADYAISYFLAVAAVACTLRGPRRWGWAAGAVCLIFSLALYQANLGVTMALCLCLFVLHLLRGGVTFQRQDAFFLGRLLAMGAVGVAGYWFTVRLSLRLYKTVLSGISGINLVGQEGLGRLPGGLKQAYSDFYAYFFQYNVVSQNYYGQRTGYFLLFAFCAFAALGLVLNGRDKKARLTRIGALALLLFLPVCANITDAINPRTEILLRMAEGMTVVVPFCIAFLETSFSELPLPKGKCMALCAVFCAVLLRGYVLQINNDALVLLTEKKQLVSLATRICVRLEENEDCQAGLPVLVVGQPNDGTYAEASPLYEKASALVRSKLLVGDDASFNFRSWKKLFWEELGLSMNWCTEEQAQEIFADDAFSALPIYPAEGSIQTLQGVVVVKISDF